jgi:hypothetical protein
MIHLPSPAGLKHGPKKMRTDAIIAKTSKINDKKLPLNA